MLAVSAQRRTSERLVLVEMTFDDTSRTFTTTMPFGSASTQAVEWRMTGKQPTRTIFERRMAALT